MIVYIFFLFACFLICINLLLCFAIIIFEFCCVANKYIK